MATPEWLNKVIVKKEVVDFHFEEKLLYIECINKNSVAEEILDTMKKNLGENYHYGIKPYNKYWKENSHNENLVVYAKEKE
jgi:hypothetical protein